MSGTIGNGNVVFFTPGVNAASLVTGAENGTVVVANKVRLGTNPLLATTTIPLAGHGLFLTGAGSFAATPSNGVQTANVFANSAGIVGFQFTTNAGTVPQVYCIGQNNGAAITATLYWVLNTGPNVYQGYSTKDDSGIIPGSLGQGIVCADAVDLVGEYYAANYSAQGIAVAGDRWKPDVGYLKANFAGNVGSLNLRNQAATQTATLFTVPAGFNQLLRVNVAFLINGLGATTNVILDLLYTDEASNVQTVNLINTGVINPDNTLTAIVIYAEKATTVRLRATLNIPGATYNLYATCEYLGVQN